MSLAQQITLLAARTAAEFKSVRSALTGKADKTTSVGAGTGLSGGGDLSASRSLAVVYGTTAGTAAQGNDSRLSDARTPTAHTHDDRYYTEGEIDGGRLGLYSSGVTDWNNVRSNGFYMAAGAANAPTSDGSWWKGIVFVHNDMWVTQLLGQFTDGTPTQAWMMRHSVDNGGGTRTWGAWHRVQLTQAAQDARYVQLTDARLTDARTPTSHTHPSTQITGLGNAATRNVGTVAGTVVDGADSRLSDARTPTAHTHTKSQITDFTHTHPSSDITTGRLAPTTGVAGGTAYLSDLNNGTSSGWYYADTNSTNAPFGVWFVEVVASDVNNVMQTVTTVQNDTAAQEIRMRRRKLFGTWSDWAFVVSTQDGTDQRYPLRADYQTDKTYGTRTVTVATTGTNITLSGLQIIDGVQLTTSHRVLVKDQTDQSQNGIYKPTSGAWYRAPDADTSDKIAGATVISQLGTRAGQMWFTNWQAGTNLGVAPMYWNIVPSQALLGDSGWITPTLQNSWRQYPDGWEPVGFRKIGNIVYLRGLITGGTTGASVVFQLPAGARPSSDSHVPIANAGSIGYINVFANGNVQLNSTPGGNAWVSLANIAFPVDAAASSGVMPADTGWLQLLPYMASGWTFYGGGWRIPSYRKIGSQVFLRGLILRSGAAVGAGTTILTMPAGLRPTENEILDVRTELPGAPQNVRLDLYYNGPLTTQGVTISTGGWINLGNNTYFTD